MKPKNAALPFPFIQQNPSDFGNILELDKIYFLILKNSLLYLHSEKMNSTNNISVFTQLHLSMNVCFRCMP